MEIETRQCLACERKMIKVYTGMIHRPSSFSSKMEAELVWWCKCGQIQEADNEFFPAPEALLYQIWRMINQEGLQIQGRYCPQCGKRMVERYMGAKWAVYPPLYRRSWWCGCGYVEEGKIKADWNITLLNYYRRLWEEVNQDTKKDE